MLDLKIEGGEVIDGTSSPRRRADIGVHAGKIVAVGEVRDSAARTIDAGGLIVAPGFIDIHTHYDAQIMWDPLGTPSCLHGVTTVIGGNCGFTIAPMQAEHAEYLSRMLSKVEGIPLGALQAGLDFRWNSFGDYLDRLEGNAGINVGFLVGHSTIRRMVMGADAVGGAASDAQVGRMCELMDTCLAEGGLGLSSSWSTAHNDADGNPVPSRAADSAELVALSGVVGRHAGTTLEFAPGLYGQWGTRETDLMIDMSRIANRPINWNSVRVREANADSVERQLHPSSVAEKRGARIVALSYPDLTSMQLSLANLMMYETLPGWRDTMRLPLEARMRVFADPAERRRLLDGASRVTRPPQTHIVNWPELRFEQIFADDLKSLVGRKVGEVAAERGVSPFDAFLDVSLADDLRTYIKVPSDPDDDEAWRLRLKLWRDPRVVLGGSDAGAHVDSLCSAAVPTLFLGETVRRRKLLPLEEAIHRMTDIPARLYGLRGRGRIAAGWHADLVVFDPHTIAREPVHIRHDFPGGASRLFADATGMAYVIVNGVEVLRGGRHTGQLPGTVLRSGRDTDTVTVG